ncbi:hypothetical protein [Methyloligella solikamskensis]|uniref:Uncharacterized protein n=1 Tax=Methyloligella solikamskensis TaxID=1177756 RepID=A0ABW3J7P2_9HYPH
MRLAIWGKANPLLLFREYLSVVVANDPDTRHMSDELISRVYERAYADRMNPIIQELLLAFDHFRKTRPDVFQQMIALLVKGYPVLGAIIASGDYSPNREKQRHEDHKTWLAWLLTHNPSLFAEAYFELLCQFMPELNQASRADQLRHIDQLVSNHRNRSSIQKSICEGLDSWANRDPKGCRQFRRKVEFMRLSVRAAEEAGRRENRPRWVSDR